MGKNGQKWVSFLFKVVFRNILNCCSCNNATNTRVYCSIFMKLPTVVNIPVSNKLTSQGDCATFQSWEKEIDTISPCFGETRSYVMLKIIDMSKSFNSSRHLSGTLPMYLLYLYVFMLQEQQYYAAGIHGGTKDLLSNGSTRKKRGSNL